MKQIEQLTKSRERQKVEPYYTLVTDLLGGRDSMIDAGERYLPRNKSESEDAYLRRLRVARFSDIFGSILENLASKPFSKEAAISDGLPQHEALVEDIDQSGNHLHVFLARSFWYGLAYGIDWILVDHQPLPEGATRADEQRMGMRPYWTHIPAPDMLAVHTARVDGKQQYIYARMVETETRPARIGELDETVYRVRELIRDPIRDESGEIVGYDAARYVLWLLEDSNWRVVAEGPISIGVIPLVAFRPLMRGTDGSAEPPLRAVAELQVDHYRDENALAFAKNATAYPIYAGNGITPARDAAGNIEPIEVGPLAVLYGPPGIGGTNGGRWEILEPGAQSLVFLSAELGKTEGRMRELGRVPLTGGTAGLTQVAAAFASQQSSSALQAWTYMLKDGAEQAWVYTSMFLGTDRSPNVVIHTDFAVEIGAEAEPQLLQADVKDGRISLGTYWRELQRRAILSPDFDADAEADSLLGEIVQGNETLEL